jgi:hypothetical protein
MHKKVKTLALIELSSVLDMHGLEYQKIKRRKLRKRIKSKTFLNQLFLMKNENFYENSENPLFGAYLTDIYNTDRRRDNNCRIPSILNAVRNMNIN